MQIDLDTLPDDPAILQQLLRDVVHQHGALHAENDKLRLLIQRLLRQQFGRRSEQLSPDQLQLGLEDLEQSPISISNGLLARLEIEAQAQPSALSFTPQSAPANSAASVTRDPRASPGRCGVGRDQSL